MSAILAGVEPIDRSTFLGASDAAPVLGVSPHLSAVELWQEKTGRRAPRERSDPELARILERGKRLEPYIRDMAIDKLRDEGHEVELLAWNQRYSDAEHPFLSCEIDFELRLDGERVDVDAKSVNSRVRHRWGEVGTDQIPLEHAAQFMDQMMITGRPRTLVAALRSFDDVDLYWLKRDDVTIAAMRARMVQFWTEHVVADVAPDPMRFSDVRALFPKAMPTHVEATPAIAKLVQELRGIGEQAKALADREGEIKFQIAQFMGDRALLTAGVRNLISWDDQTTMRFDVKAFRRKHSDWAALFTNAETARVMRFAAKR